MKARLTRQSRERERGLSKVVQWLPLSGLVGFQSMQVCEPFSRKGNYFNALPKRTVVKECALKSTVELPVKGTGH